jgi:predicted acetyltransferase
VLPSHTAETLPAPPDSLHHGDITLRFVHIVPGDPSRDFVPSYHFRILTKDGSNAGHVNFRIGDTAHVQICAGHIGFEIAESFRGHGYAFQACLAIAPFVRTVYDSVIITCDPDNHVSRRTIEKLGAVYVDEVLIPPHEPMYQRGLRSKLRYRWTP